MPTSPLNILAQSRKYGLNPKASEFKRLKIFRQLTASEFKPKTRKSKSKGKNKALKRKKTRRKNKKH